MNKKSYIKLTLFITSMFFLIISISSLKSYSRILNKNYTESEKMSKELESDVKNLEYQIMDNPENIENDYELYYYAINEDSSEIYTNIPKGKAVKDTYNRGFYTNDGYIESESPSSYIREEYFENISDNGYFKGYIFIPERKDTTNINVYNFERDVENKKISDLDNTSMSCAFSFIAFLVLFLLSIKSVSKSVKYIENKSVSGKNVMLFIRLLSVQFVAINLGLIGNYHNIRPSDITKNFTDYGMIGFMLIEVIFIIVMMTSIITRCATDDTLKKYVKTEFDLVKLIYNSKGFVFKILYTVLIGGVFFCEYVFLDYIIDFRYILVTEYVYMLANTLGKMIVTISVFMILHIFITRLFLSRYCHNKLAKGEEIDFDFENLWFKSMMNSFIKIQNQYKGFKKTSKASIDMRNELITNMSHDIKTPLTSIINYIELIKSSENCKGDIKEYADVLSVKADTLNNLINDLFDISKLNSGSIVLRKSKINFKNLIEQVVGELDYEIKEKNLTFVLNFDENLKPLNGDSNYLYRAINNVVINITKYAKENTTAYIDVLQQEDIILVDMKNISENEFSDNDKNLFERFTRGDESRNTKGHGLGLSIFSEIISLHDGNCNINTIGNTFILTFTIKN